ncbi:MAG: 30S ribosomal protein S16 [Patescibacteria group bacterium]|nr:30S ribosomal protein S16 [Patescibacteria group bacterium]
MLKIRLTRRGKKNKAFFWLVVAEHTSPIKGRFIEALGFFNPHTKEKNLKADRIKYWIEKGAQCSDSVHNLLVSAGIAKGPKRVIKMKKKAETTDSAKETVSEKNAKEAKAEALEKKEKTGDSEKAEKTNEAKKKAEEAKKEQ